ncbi:MAG TPA: glycosyltransferase family 2 protein [Candidatus Cybelea sp.]|nr:glycosyltransferase family 2 protein [Candidatus Cybelea sp.]
MTAPQLSVVIPVFNNWWLTARCLRELERLRETSSVPFETIVVDNGSSDETPERMASFSWVRYVRFEANRNFAGACNAGAQAATAPLTLLLNNDAYPLGDAFAPLVRAFERPDVAIAGGALFFEDGVTQAAGLVVLPNAHWHYFCRNLPPTLDPVGRSRDALAVSGAAMAFRTEWFLQNGAFDESFVNGFEDVDLCMRAREAKRGIVYAADARFAHYEAASAGRFDREAENERRFFARWSNAMATLPRTARGSVGAIVVRAARAEDALLAAARADLEGALRSFGHPVVRRTVAPWQRIDRRFRDTATLAWFAGEPESPGIAIGRSGGPQAQIRTFGAIGLEVPWLPCAASDRVGDLAIRRSDDASCLDVGIAGDEGGSWGERVAALGYRPIELNAERLLGRVRIELACVLHAGRTDDASFGSVLLAQAGLPAIVIAGSDVRALFAADVAVICEEATLPESISRYVADAALRRRYGTLVAADSRRRFSPRRSAIRVVDLLCAARFGLERPGAARGNTPI